MQTNFEKRNPANPCYPIHPKAYFILSEDNTTYLTGSKGVIFFELSFIKIINSDKYCQ